MEISYHVPGTTVPGITIRRSILGSLTVLADGVPARRHRGVGPTYDIPLPDGSVRELRLTGQWTGLKAIVDGLETPLEPTMPGYVLVMSLLPLGLVAIGGLIGGLFGGLAAAINAGLARQSLRLPVKVGAMLGVTAQAVVLYFVVARAFVGAIAPIPTLETGSCINGIRNGATVTSNTTRAVDCTTPHDNEVAGSFIYSEGGEYPGRDTLQSFGQASCLDAVRACSRPMAAG